MDREVKQLKQSRIPIVKVRWNPRRGPEFTWEREDYFKSKYPHLFSNKKKAKRIDEAVAAGRERVQNENNLEVPPPAPTPAPTTDPATNPVPGSAAGLTAGTATRECTFAGFLKCNPTSFHGNERAVDLSRWIEKSKSVFDISKCAKGNKVIFSAATLQDSALT
ncbi:hypothetical protein Tco_0681766 [Tanacetum coccineum]|uniref:Reverse transcriptase domain-containing protein n=1 Tax=Tanacetum coccineum TaxID=301880 RepID=A0ABQ4XP96_9ASTR